MNPFSPFCGLGAKVHNWLGLRPPGMAALQWRMMDRFCQNNFSKEHVIRCFEQWNADVIRHCPPEKLLVFEVSEGWEPLCRFLGKPIPDVPFPRINDGESFKTNYVQLANRIGYAILAGVIVCVSVPVSLAVGYYYGMLPTNFPFFSISSPKLLTKQ